MLTLKQFFENESDKVMRFCEKYSARDKEGKVHCNECPYGFSISYHCECLFGKYLEEIDNKGLDNMG